MQQQLSVFPDSSPHLEGVSQAYALALMLAELLALMAAAGLGVVDGMADEAAKGWQTPPKLSTKTTSIIISTGTGTDLTDHGAEQEAPHDLTRRPPGL